MCGGHQCYPGYVGCGISNFKVVLDVWLRAAVGGDGSN